MCVTWAVDTEELVAKLTPREARILRMRFGFGAQKEHILEEIGDEFSLTRERIRQVEGKPLSELRRVLRREALRARPPRCPRPVRLRRGGAQMLRSS